MGVVTTEHNDTAVAIAFVHGNVAVSQQMRKVLTIANTNQYVYRTARVNIHLALLALVYQHVRQTRAAEGEIPFFATFDNHVCRATTVELGITKLRTVEDDVSDTATIKVDIAASHIGLDDVTATRTIEAHITRAFTAIGRWLKQGLIGVLVDVGHGFAGTSYRVYAVMQIAE